MMENNEQIMIDDIIKEKEIENNKKEIKKKFDNLSEQYLLQGVLTRRLAQFVKDNENNAVLTDYIKLLEDVQECQKSVTKCKDELYEVMEKGKEKSISNEFIDVTCKFAYKRTKFDEKSYFKDNPISEEKKKKYIVENITKGNITIKDKH